MFRAPFPLAAALLLAAIPCVAADNAQRSGKEVYDIVCVACHKTGAKGAPKTGDRDAWVPRMKTGIDKLTLAAIRGHGGMPARGGLAQLTDPEVKAAIHYMWDPEAEFRAATRKK